MKLLTRIDAEYEDLMNADPIVLPFEKSEVQYAIVDLLPRLILDITVTVNHVTDDKSEYLIYFKSLGYLCVFLLINNGEHQTIIQREYPPDFWETYYQSMFQVQIPKQYNHFLYRDLVEQVKNLDEVNRIRAFQIGAAKEALARSCDKIIMTYVHTYATRLADELPTDVKEALENYYINRDLGMPGEDLDAIFPRLGYSRRHFFRFKNTYDRLYRINQPKHGT